MALHLALALSLAETIALACVLLVWAQHVPGARLLTVFLLGVAIWITGNELPNWFGPEAVPFALPLMSTIPLTSAAFLHFCLVFCRLPLRRRWLALAYGLAGAATVLAWLVRPADFVHFPAFTGVDLVAVPNWVGWTSSTVWGLLAAAGVLVLMFRFWRPVEGLASRQVAAVMASCAWGLFCMSGYGFAALEIPVYPWQVLAMPAYPVILVYGILRYQVFVANAWARRALAWTLLIAFGLLTVPLALALPVESRWVSGALVAAVCLTLNGPVRRFAERIVYPGGTVTAEDLRAWRRELAATASAEQLAAVASQVLSRRVGLHVAVQVAVAGPATAGAPLLACTRGVEAWETALVGWEAAPPGRRHLAELFAGVLSDAALQLEHATLAQERERERQVQARLAELGALATSVAHDLRNPLNIIAMAVATAPDETRREVAGQVDRISRLVQDLLDYAKPWQVNPVPLDAALQVREALRRQPGVELGSGFDAPLTIHADPLRFEQALLNLLSNARTAAGTRHVRIDAERGGDAVLLHVCDDGPGVPADLRERLFEPFASRSPGGTGLGLAIVARIMAAHGGSVRLEERPPWNTCFTLRFPAAP